MLTISPSVLHAAVLSYGDSALFAGVAAALAARKPLRVLFLGASPTCGHFDSATPTKHDPLDRPVGLNHTFASVLLAGLETLYPVSAGSGAHSAVSECHGGAASDRWLQELAFWRSTPESGPWQRGPVDFIVIETGLTDGGETAEVQRQTEIVIELLLAWPHPRPAFLLLSTLGTRLQGDDDWDGARGGRKRGGDAAAAHSAVTLHHGVPQLSPVDAASPLSAERAEWWRHAFRADERGHPSLLGHDLAGCLLLALLQQHVLSLAAPMLPNEAAPLYAPSPQLFSTQAEAQLFTKGYPKLLRLDVADNGARGSEYWGAAGAWSLRRDAGRAQGLIAESVGDRLAFTFPPSLVKGHFRFGVVSVTMLKTYEGVGRLAVRCAPRSAASILHAADAPPPTECGRASGWGRSGGLTKGAAL